MDRLGALKLFLQAVEAGTISGAGRRLGLYFTAASRALQELEAALGLRLLDRTTRRLSPTAAGRRLRAKPVPVLSDLDAALREAADFHEQPRGVLRVSARRSFGLLHVVPAVADFRAAFPQVGIDLGLTEETELRPGDGTDPVIRLGLPAGKSLVGVPLAFARRILCASPAHLARRGAGGGGARLPRVPARKRAAGLDLRNAGRYARGGDLRAAPLQQRRGAAAGGARRARLGPPLTWMVRHDVAAERLVAHLPEHRAHPAGHQAAIYAVHARGPAAVPAKVAAFVARPRAALPPVEAD